MSVRLDVAATKFTRLRQVAGLNRRPSWMTRFPVGVRATFVANPAVDLLELLRTL